MGNIGYNGECGDGEPLIGIPEGEHYFRVRNVTKGFDEKHQCDAATVTLEVRAGETTATIQDKLPCHTAFEWKLGAFFKSLGLRKSGEKLRMNWDAAVGQWGRCKIVIKKGRERDFHNIGSYLDRNGKQPPAWCVEPLGAAAAPAPQRQAPEPTEDDGAPF